MRGKEEVPKVDFAQEFVVVQTSSSSTITEIGLILRRGRVGNWSAETVKAGQRIQGFTYGIGIFRRERVDVVGGKIIPKK